MEYARFNKGQTYTGIPWKFHHYGPWDADLFLRIDSSLTVINAIKKISCHPDGTEIVRWFLSNSKLFDSLNTKLHIQVAGAIQRYVRQFGNNTSKLLHFVYGTKPMLSAAPGDFLSFGTMAKHDDVLSPIEQQEEHTARQLKKKKAMLADFKTKFQNKLIARIETRKQYVIQEPRYDSVFDDAVKHLESMYDLSEIEGETGVLEFSKDIWDSDMRKVSDEQ
jgi:hypothetical protein